MAVHLRRLCEWKQWLPNKSVPHQDTIFYRLSKIILSGLQHSHIWEHKGIQLVEWFVLVWEEEKRRREDIQIWNFIFFKLGIGPQRANSGCREKDLALSSLTVTYLNQDGKLTFPQISPIILGRPDRHIIQRLRYMHVASSFLPHPEKVRKLLIIHSSLLGESLFAFWNHSPTVQLETTSWATNFSRHHAHGFYPSLAVREVWQTWSGNMGHKGSSE